ncbi:hypothetical protein SAMN04488564_10497 [Lentzea waywayandensis]|uniref:Uncharacterized protein n=1 Tax=Lentzea waywayandensis TaxID=84724 RepID=A0A1I6ECM0_9PSEU|nr:hypothetical protein [Lentzea waywayandensis]SFR15238.1 hypothetical protein SAMN04488564_10497 [Lentzea waywayandensis]
MSELLRRAAALIPGDARSDAGCTSADVLDYLDHNEPEVAHGVLEDFDGIAWQTDEFWDLLVESAQQMRLSTEWIAWRKEETRHGLLRAELDLAAEADPIPAGVRRGTRWDLGDGVLRLAAMRIESMPVLEPGRTAVVRLRPAEPWQHLSVGAVIALHESQPMVGVATVIELVRVGETRQRDR